MNSRQLLTLSALVLVLSPSLSHAYLDPGSGHVIWQYLLAAALGGIFYIKRIYYFFVKLLRGGVAKDKDNAPGHSN